MVLTSLVAKRFSSSGSARPLVGDKPPRPGPLRHELWLPDTDTGPEPRGMLMATADLDHNGHIPDKYSLVFDKFYYKIASSLATMHHAGFAPVLDAMGLQLDYGRRPYFYDQQYYIKATFPPTETLVTLGNSVLEKCGAELRLTSVPPGFIQTETFLDLLSEGRYPISECYPTPDKESDDNEYGAHDMLLHAAAAMAIATTDAYPVVRAQARQSQQLLGDYDIPYKDASDAVDTFMAHVDNGIHVMNCRGILIDDDHVPYFQRMLGWDLPRDQRDIYQQQVVDTICDPLSYGFRGLSGGTS